MTTLNQIVQEYRTKAAWLKKQHKPSRLTRVSQAGQRNRQLTINRLLELADSVDCKLFMLKRAWLVIGRNDNAGKEYYLDRLISLALVWQAKRLDAGKPISFSHALYGMAYTVKKTKLLTGLSTIDTFDYLDNQQVEKRHISKTCKVKITLRGAPVDLISCAGSIADESGLEAANAYNVIKKLRSIVSPTIDKKIDSVIKNKRLTNDNVDFIKNLKRKYNVFFNSLTYYNVYELLVKYY
jgi:hypothetical protein